MHARHARTDHRMSIQNENEYEDLLSLWSDLEAGLAIILGSPGSIQEFRQRVGQYDRWMQGLLERDTDVGLYLLFQLAVNSPVGYSASHALVSAVLCHLIAKELRLPPRERDPLVYAALTMNIGMTALQDELANQIDKPSPEQQEAIRAHPMKGESILNQLGIVNELWLDIVSSHHDESTSKGDLRRIPPAHRLSRVLRVVDRYAAMISPRKSRSGRSASESMRSLIGNTETQNDEVVQALMRVVGFSPPGTYVRLNDGEIAVVMRRSNVANQPDVAIVVNQVGVPIKQPRLHRTTQGEPAIEAALPSTAVRDRLNHHLILQLGAYVAPQP